MKILITGGAGYIGSITNAVMKKQGTHTVVFDNLSQGHAWAVKDGIFVKGDLQNQKDIDSVFKQHSFDGVIHFAALALAGESMEKPYEYYKNNILGGLNLLEAMRRHGCKNIVFSSTCAVYGYPKELPVTEKSSTQPVSVYGSSKHMYEEIISWYGRVYDMRYVILRYFNASGAMLDGSLGECHSPETHIIPLALDVAIGRNKIFNVYGNDYKTKDGTCLRDYIHVLDLADAHIKALEFLTNGKKSVIFNLGAGKSYSNLQVLKMVEKVTGQKIRKVFKARRPGDPAAIYADNSKIQKILHWRPKYSDLQIVVESAWKWHKSKLKA